MTTAQILAGLIARAFRNRLEGKTKLYVAADEMHLLLDNGAVLFENYPRYEKANRRWLITVSYGDEWFDTTVDDLEKVGLGPTTTTVH